MEKQRYASLSNVKKCSAWLASLSLSLAVSSGLRYAPPTQSMSMTDIARYTSQSERLTEYLFEGVEAKSLWV